MLLCVIETFLNLKSSWCLLLCRKSKQNKTKPGSLEAYWPEPCSSFYSNDATYDLVFQVGLVKEAFLNFQPDQLHP